MKSETADITVRTAEIIGAVHILKKNGIEVIRHRPDLHPMGRAEYRRMSTVTLYKKDIGRACKVFDEEKIEYITN